ncbi:histidinol-phosphatase [Gleimia hominis]|uniref:histidinol-phosphatase n=1 Tax=Gleimia hominis TaxID=595468 RepID=UPI000C80F7EB|nr:histidinol-phosphatase [Gleimia hominis]WIK64785.1 histidinol-phosphatase [Gleimia hominis]
MNQRNLYNDDLRLAHVLADQADSVTTSYFQSTDLRVEEKSDHSPVTVADRQTEQTIRRQLSTARSRDSVYGEEMGTTGRSTRVWVIDPIDGTKNFVRGVPVWATLISLVEDGDVVVGVVSAPALGRRWWAAKGQGAYTGTSLLRGKQIHVSNVHRLEDASLSYASLDNWRKAGRFEEFNALTQRTARTRAYGDFWSHMLVAEGAVDFALDPKLEAYDMAAPVAVVQEAGGVFTSLLGDDGPWGGTALSSNGHFHDEVLSILNWPEPQ